MLGRSRWLMSGSVAARQTTVDGLSVRYYSEPMETIGAAELKQKCLALLDRIGPEGLVITKHGKPVAKLVPISSVSAELIGSLEGKVRVRGDILSTGLEWSAES